MQVCKCNNMLENCVNCILRGNNNLEDREKSLTYTNFHRDSCFNGTTSKLWNGDISLLIYLFLSMYFRKVLCFPNRLGFVDACRLMKV